MTPHALTNDEWLLSIALEAEELRASISDRTPEDAFRLIKSLVDDAEIALGVWPDASAKTGFGFKVIKGKRLVADIASGRKGPGIDALVAAIPCSCVEQAIAASRVWGGLH